MLIPSNVEILGSKCFSYCESLSSITFESNSHLIRIESEAFYKSSLETIMIPKNVEILGSKCFSYCKSLSSITFESNSHLTRIESEAFSYSSLQSIIISQNVQFIDGSAFIGVNLSSISIESGNKIFVIEKGFLIDIVHHKLIRNFSTSSGIEIAEHIEIVGSKCFSSCKSLLSITFESNSHLTRIESEAFSFSFLQSILIPSTILFIASDAVDFASQIRLLDGNSCPEFDRWLQLKRSGIVIDFRRIDRMGFDIPCLDDYIIDLSVFEERSIIGGSDEFRNVISHRIEDEFVVIVKSKPHSQNIEKSDIANEIEKMMNLRHPCITPPIGFVFGIESGHKQELKIVRMYLEGCSLFEVVSVNPIWWTSTVKAKAIAGIVLGLRFAHSLGLLHGHLTMNNILFDSDHCIQIVDFKSIGFEIGESESRRESEKKHDWLAFQVKDGHRRGIFKRLRQFFLN
jgi:tRNA A-37 threonylcarbamoyl transferase component Bud32